MMKKLIPAAVLMTLVGAAQAQVTMYGLIDMSYGKNEMVGETKEDIHSGGDAGQHGGSQGNSTTKVGLKGSTDVGSGVKANFQLETGGVHSDGSIQGPFFGRQAWAGLSGSFGEVRVGLQDSVAFQTMIGLTSTVQQMLLPHKPTLVQVHSSALRTLWSVRCSTSLPK